VILDGVAKIMLEFLPVETQDGGHFFRRYRNIRQPQRIDENGIDWNADGKRPVIAIVDISTGRLNRNRMFLLFPGERKVLLVMQSLHRYQLAKNCGGPDQDRRYKKG